MTDELESIAVDMGHGRSRTMAELIGGWQRHVTRLDEESRMPVQRSTWGAHDYFAALSLRDWVRDGASSLSSDLKRLVDFRVSDADRLLRHFTDPDARGLVARFGRATPGADAWWWHRIPRSGPVRDELETWLARAAQEPTSQ